MSKIRKTIAGLLSIGLMVCAASTPVSADWVKNNGKTYYEDENGEYLTGWQTIDDAKYYFNSKGIMKTGWVTMKSGNQYYFTKKTGKMVTGFAKIKGETYYFGKNGILQKGYIKVNNKIYYFNEESGELVEQVYSNYVRINGKLYFCKSDGTLAKGMLSITNSYGRTTTYYFGDDYSSQTTTKVIDGVTYIFDSEKGLVEHYTEIPYSGFYGKNIQLTDFTIKKKGTTVYLSGALKNCESILSRDIYARADLYDKDGYIIASDYVLFYCRGLKAGQTYKISDSLTSRFKDLNKVVFTKIIVA